MSFHSEEQPEYLGYCRHCQAGMYRIDGKIRTLHDCTSDGHEVERRKDFIKRKEYKDEEERNAQVLEPFRGIINEFIGGEI